MGTLLNTRTALAWRAPGRVVLLPWRVAREAAAGWVPRGAAALTQGFAYLIRLHERSRQRGQLQGLDERMLKDIGLSRDDIRRELPRVFWEG